MLGKKKRVESHYSNNTLFPTCASGLLADSRKKRKGGESHYSNNTLFPTCASGVFADSRGQGDHFCGVGGAFAGVAVGAAGAVAGLLQKLQSARIISL
jgi:hypothetical protein